MKLDLQELNIFDKILMKIFPGYTEKIYRLGVIDYFNWNNKESSHGCNTAVQVKYKCKDIKGGKLRESKNAKY